MGGDAFPEFMWMGAWGVPQLPAHHFLGGRMMTVLRSSTGPLELSVPEAVRQQAYNPSISLLPDATRKELGCSPTCVYAVTVRVDWMTQCATARLRIG